MSRLKAAINKLTLIASMCLVVGSMSACSTMVAPEEDGTTEYVFEQSSSDQVLSKADDSATSGKVEED